VQVCQKHIEQANRRQKDLKSEAASKVDLEPYISQYKNVAKRETFASQARLHGHL